jgi:hypothetical protein
MTLVMFGSGQVCEPIRIFFNLVHPGQATRTLTLTPKCCLG